jgi:tripartite-type tricarboxylate transporter receptor subunit TctC
MICSARAWVLGGTVLAWFGAVNAGMAQDVSTFYRGKTVTVVVGSSAGGGYDLYGRLIARYLPRHIPGNPAVIVQNMPGSASNVAASHVFSAAPKDGTVIGAIFMGAVVAPLFGDQRNLSYDASQFNYIGNANIDAYVCLVREDAPVKAFADAFEKELVVGGSASGASTRDFPSLLKNLLGVKFKIVAGYPGTREINDALEKGEIQGGCGQTWSSVAATYPKLFKSNLIKPLVQESNKGYAELDKLGVPLVRQFAKTDEQRQILDLFYSQQAFSRPYVVAPGVPQARVAALRQAFMATMSDPDLVAEAKREKVDIAPTSGDDLQRLIMQIYATPPDIAAKARAATAFRP